MSRLGAILGLLPRTPTVWRTLRHVRFDQARAQIQHMLHGLPEPRRLDGPPPPLAVAGPRTGFRPPPPHVRVGTTDEGRPEAVELLDRRVPLAPGGPPLDWAAEPHGPLVAYHLHEHDWLRHVALAPESRAALLEDWLARHATGIGWDPHPISLRLLAWGKLLLTPGVLPPDEALRARLRGSLADQAETLAAGLEIRLQANHLLSNRLGVVWAGVLLGGDAPDRWLGTAPRLLEELDAQVHPDGGHEERSPMYHALLLEGVLDLLNLSLESGRASDALCEGLAAAAGRMLQALDQLCHPDGRIALFADSAFDVAAEPAELLAYARALGVDADVERPGHAASAHLPQTGYLRLAAEPWLLIASVAGPSPPHQPGHAHADALAVELSVAGHRLVTDTGVFEYQPGEARRRARSTQSHATLQLAGREQAELWAAHRVGGRPEVGLTAWDGAGAAEARCRAWWRGAPEHRRDYRVDGAGVEIVDRVDGPARGPGVEVVARWPLAPDWQVTLGEDGTRRVARAEAPAAPPIEIELPASLDWRVEPAACHPGFHREAMRSVLVGRGRAPLEATTRFRIVT